MKTSGILLALFYAPVFCLLWLTKHAVDCQLSGPEVVTGAYRGSVKVSCQYDHQYRENTKYWCKGRIYGLCVILTKTPRDRGSNRSSIADDKEAGVFTVTMTSLEYSDQDMYWCVVARPGRNEYTGVQLRVSDTVTTTASTTPANPSPMTADDTLWAILRWILLLLMLCCVVLTHVVTWRMKTAREILIQQQFQPQNSNIYD